MPSEVDLAALLKHAGWTRTLARSLASDVDLAEDLVQDAWVAALERPPDLARPVRGWLAAVLRHRWLDLGRARRRREEREREVAGREAWPSSHDVVEKAAIQRELVEAVLTLDEPYRTTVLLRFFEDLPRREIARRTGASIATVNSRLTRALARLRERLSRSGGGQAWLHVLVPLLREPATAPAVALGAGAMKLVVTSVVLAASLVAGFALWSAHGNGGSAARSPDASIEPPSVALDGDTAAPSSRAQPVEGEERRVVLAPEVATLPSTPVAPAPSTRVVRGRVIDASGRAVSGIALALSSSASETAGRSDASGRFEITLDEPADAIVSADPRFATVLAGSARVHDATEPTVVVAPSIDVAGAVLDESRAPLADAALELRLPADFGAEWGFALDYSIPQRWRARSGAAGDFALRAVPALVGAELCAALAGFAPAEVEAPLRSTNGFEVVLARPGAAAGLVHGVVLDPAGARVEGARVSAGDLIARTDGRGEFTLDVRTPGSAARILALARGLLPATFEPVRGGDGEPLWPAEVVLQLGGPADTIAGRVVDAEGRPIGGAKVWIDDPTPFGRTPDARLVAESLLRGDERFWSFEQTDADGKFALGGCMLRSYRVQAVDPRTLASVESPPVSAADSPIELRLPTHDVYPRVAGRVVSASGAPLAGAKVRLFRITYELEHVDGTDNDSVESEPVVTGADGAFEFRDVPRDGVELIASGDTILGAGASLAPPVDPERVEIVASLRLHLQVELDEPRDRADGLRVFDRDGRRVLLSVFHGEGAHADFEMSLLDGRSQVMSVDENAATLVLYRGVEEVARVALHLTPGPTNVVRY